MVQRIAMFALAVLVALLHVLLRGAWLDGLLAGITLAMAILPEEFPVVLTVFLALGTRHRRRARSRFAGAAG